MMTTDVSRWNIKFVLLSITVSGVLNSEGGPSRPHIVFILGDDVGWADLSFRGATQIPTPNMDALAADGIILNKYYVQPACSPSRAALLTGVYPFRTGMQHYPIAPAEPWGLPLDLKLMPEYFRGLGYETHLIGKWHLGYYKEEYTPLHRGFDSFYGFYNGELDYYNHTTNHMGFHDGLDFWYNETPLLSVTGNYTTSLFSQHAGHVINTRDQTKPLFLLISNHASHCGPAASPTPLQAPAENIQKFRYIEEKNRTIFAGMMDALDQSVGDVLEFLSDANMLENTILVYSSDNGAVPFGIGSNSGFNWPLRGAKTTLWEGGVRAAAFVWSPLLNTSRRLSEQMMHIVDWAPTLYAAAGGNPEDLGNIDGINLWKELSNNMPMKRRELVYNTNSLENASAMRYENYKLLLGISTNGRFEDRYQVPGGTRPYDDLDMLMEQSTAAAILQRFHGTEVFEYPQGWREATKVNCQFENASNFVPLSPPYLFDIDADPCELNNLAEAKPQMVRMLKEKLGAYAVEEVLPLNQPEEPKAYPDYHDGIWGPWED